MRSALTAFCEGEIMKKVFVSIAFAMCGAAQAAGPYDGIYVNLNGGFASVQTNGDQILVIGLSTMPSSGVVVSSALGSITPSSMETWDVAMGTVQGTAAQVSGTTMYGACTYSMRIEFAGAGGTARITGASNTAVGNASRINCPALVNSPAISYLKAF